MERFTDYMYYLLPTPFKKIQKKINQWYIYCKVLGWWFDIIKEELLRAADETTIATCSDDLLKYYGNDRDLAQYVGEDNDTFRSRIAMSDGVVSLGGTKEGILMSVLSIGYTDAVHIWCPSEDGNMERWAEFILQLNVPEGTECPVTHDILRSEVREVKESISLDNYRYCYRSTAALYVSAGVAVTNTITVGDY